MLGNWVRNWRLISILSIWILGDDWGIRSSVTEGHKETSSTDRRALDGPSWGPSHQFPCIFSKFPWMTSTTDRRAPDGLSCATVMVVRDPTPKGLKIFSKCPMTDLYDGPSCSWLSVLQNRHGCKRPIIKGLKTFSMCLTTDLYDGPSCSRRSVLHHHHDCQRLFF